MQLNSKSEKILGKKGVKRFKEFIGSDLPYLGIKPKDVNPLSVDYLNDFLFKIGKLKYDVTLFMGLEANLEIVWKDKDDDLFNVDFFPDRIEYYLEKLEEESRVEPKDIDVLIDKIKRITFYKSYKDNPK